MLNGKILNLVIMESLVKKKQKGAILELKQRHLKKVSICINTPYLTRKIQLLGLDEVLSWLFVGGYLELMDELRNNIALLRLAIGSPVGRNDGTKNLESSCVGSALMECLVDMIDLVDVDGIQLVENDTVTFD
ncbi:hypothetical protein Tco_0801703 [Tanacetum coccineum]|uniref:Uncharacterized protein n=1 Tax=Tanacetum coccineum TaxID=301880 RepID=A0ABQ5A0Q2_9ASTR